MRWNADSMGGPPLASSRPAASRHERPVQLRRLLHHTLDTRWIRESNRSLDRWR
jgi:hypothetical protein